ncbi:MAG: hypothetical protein OEV28_01765 [Nitrospirota bacterium]|nr:hypothetical protein [Nitrospirota bacterium]
MTSETLKFDKGIIEVTVVDNIIYMKVLHLYTDEMAIEMTRYLDKVFARISGNPVRVWDSSALSAESFKLSSQCVEQISNWSLRIKSQRPGSRVYFIAKESSIYGVSRMYALKAGNENMDVMVLRSIDELPQDIRAKIPH